MKESCSVNISDKTLEPDDLIDNDLEQKYFILGAELNHSNAHQDSSDISKDDDFLELYSNFIGVKAADHLAWRSESFKTSRDI
jgi:hypothetical protein